MNTRQVTRPVMLPCRQIVKVTVSSDIGTVDFRSLEYDEAEDCMVMRFRVECDDHPSEPRSRR